MATKVSCTLNGEAVSVDVDARTLLVEMIREHQNVSKKSAWAGPSFDRGGGT